MADLIGSRDTLREAFRVGLIEDGASWMAMIQDRNLTSHTYNRATAQEIASHIRGATWCAFSGGGGVALRLAGDGRVLWRPGQPP